MDVPTSVYPVSDWEKHIRVLSLEDLHFRGQSLHIPAHIPDSLAWSDIDEHHLVVGDTSYERESAVQIPTLPGGADSAISPPTTQGAIIYPEEGRGWCRLVPPLDVLFSFVLHQNTEHRRRPGSSCESISLFKRIIAGKVQVNSGGGKRGIIHDLWLEKIDSRFSVMAARHLAEEAKKHFHPNLTGRSPRTVPGAQDG
ncbi:unnamed protein product [Diplocarpon coronariae]